MSMDNHVGMETHVCLVCGVEYDTGAILLATKYKHTRDGDMEPVVPIKPRHCTGPGVCPEHQQMIDEGFVFFVEMEKNPANPAHMTTEEFLGGRRTGLMVSLRREILPEILQHVDFDNIPPIVACEAGFVQRIAAITGRSMPTGQEGTS